MEDFCQRKGQTKLKRVKEETKCCYSLGTVKKKMYDFFF